MSNRTIDTLVTVTAETEIDIVLQDAVEINIDTPMLYVQSGKEEINYFVEYDAKPKLEEYINTEAKPLVSNIIANIAEPTVQSYVENTIKVYIKDFSDTKKNELQEIFLQAQIEAEKSQNSSSQAEHFSLSAQESAANSLVSATNAELFASAASLSATDAADLAETVQTLVTNAKDEVSQELTQADYVVENYQSGTNWYKKYKSGWVEQGGKVQGGSDKNGKTITFLKAFFNTNYNFQATPYCKDSSASDHVQSAKILTKTTSNIKILTTAQSATDAIYNAFWFDWYACGQGA